MTKAIAGMICFAIYGPYLIYVWGVPSAVPDWVMHPSTRKVMMLSRDFEPTFFTLLFGVMFTAIVLFGIVATATGKAHFQKVAREQNSSNA